MKTHPQLIASFFAMTREKLEGEIRKTVYIK